MEILLRLRADGYYVNRIHVDKGHEFAGHFMKWIHTRGIELSRTPGDDPQGNGRAELTVKSIKAQIRRTLLQGGGQLRRCGPGHYAMSTRSIDAGARESIPLGRRS